MEFLFLTAGILLGALITWLFLKGKMAAPGGADPRVAGLDRDNAALMAQVNALADEKKRLHTEKDAERSRADEQLKVLRHELEEYLDLERGKVGVLTDHLARKEAEMEALEKRLKEQKEELEQLQQRFTKEFENLANRIFEEKSKKFTEQNRTQLDDLLKPLGEKIKDFEKKVNDVYLDETKERASLKEQLSQLHQLNQQMSRDAQNLTRALKGETKTQGSWGEFILETILEKSGLVRDREFSVQASFTSEDGRKLQPDIIVNLPENKHLIIDSKVSLVAYERFIAAETEDDRALALKDHISSIKKHIKDLSEKNYHQIYQLNSPDFVLLFIPIEPAASMALQGEQELYTDALGKNIVLVAPSMLLAILRMTSNMWRQEKQNKNVLKIAEEAAAMYEKFVGFTDAMIEMGRKLDDSKKYYTMAMGRFSEGPGNVVKRIENLKNLGLKVNKSIDAKLLERSGNEEPEEEPGQ